GLAIAKLANPVGLAVTLDPVLEQGSGRLKLAAVEVLEAAIEVVILGPRDQLRERLLAIGRQRQRFELLELHRWSLQLNRAARGSQGWRRGGPADRSESRSWRRTDRRPPAARARGRRRPRATRSRRSRLRARPRG